MNTREQIRFVKQLSKNIALSICDQIKSGKIPASWDGHELRQLLADRHQESADIGVGRNRRSGRYRDYHNHKIINLL